MDERLRRFVRERASPRCEYGGLPQTAEPFFAYPIERIIARQQGGGDGIENLALACYHGNACKGPNLSALDPESGVLVRLFRPRQEFWEEHFKRNGIVIVGRTATAWAVVFEDEHLELASPPSVIAILRTGDRNFRFTLPLLPRNLFFLGFALGDLFGET